MRDNILIQTLERIDQQIRLLTERIDELEKESHQRYLETVRLSQELINLKINKR